MFEEGGLRCDFPPHETRRPDQEERTLKSVDFVWQPNETTWLVEIKDPEYTPVPRQADAVRNTLKTLHSGQLTDEHFLPKLFGTYVWLARNGLLRPVVHRYAVLVALPELDSPLRSAVTDRIQRSIDTIGPVDRMSGIAPVAELHDLRTWNASPNLPGISRKA